MNNTQQDKTEYKVVYYKDGEMIIEKCVGKVWTDPNNVYKKYHTRFYPINYDPPCKSYGSEELIESW